MELRPIEGFNNRYAVSSCGKVISLPDYEMKTWKNKQYDCITLYDSATKKKVNRRVHRLVAQAWIGTPQDPACNEVNHRDGNPTNNRVENLEWLDPETHKIHTRYLAMRRAAERRAR